MIIVSILITAALTSVASKLKNQLAKPDIILGDYLEIPSFMLTAGNLIKLPNPSSAAYQHEMLTLCLDAGIDKLIALRPEEQAALAEAALLFKEYGIEIISVDDKRDP